MDRFKSSVVLSKSHWDQRRSFSDQRIPLDSKTNWLTLKREWPVSDQPRDPFDRGVVVRCIEFWTQGPTPCFASSGVEHSCSRNNGSGFSLCKSECSAVSWRKGAPHKEREIELNVSTYANSSGLTWWMTHWLTLNRRLVRVLGVHLAKPCFFCSAEVTLPRLCQWADGRPLLLL